jgi:hypothetical protein
MGSAQTRGSRSASRTIRHRCAFGIGRCGHMRSRNSRPGRILDCSGAAAAVHRVLVADQHASRLARRANAAAISIDLQAGKAGGTAAQGIFLKSTTGGTSGEIMHYVDPTGVTIFALLPDGSLLLRPLAAPPAGSKAGLKLCNVGGTLGVVDSTGTFTPLT